MCDLLTIMSVVDALVDYKYTKPSGDDEKHKSNEKGKDKQKKNGKKNKDEQKRNWGNMSKGESSTSQQSKEQPKLNASCFICNGLHRERDCPKHKKLNAMVAEDDRGNLMKKFLTR